MLCATLRRDSATVASVVRWVVVADWIFTAPAVVLQPGTGLYLVHLAGLPLQTPWIAWSLGLYVLAGACWVPVVWMQIDMRDMARSATVRGEALPARVLVVVSVVDWAWGHRVRVAPHSVLPDGCEALVREANYDRRPFREGSAGWRRAWQRAFFSGSAASIASTIALAFCGKKELNDPLTPINGPSQWILGRRAPYQDGFRFPHTIIGYAIHHTMSVMWAIVFERWLEERQRDRQFDALTAGVVVSAIACAVDYQCTPERFTPGFEKRLSRKALFLVYAAFAAGLAAASFGSRSRK